ncbi:MAG: porin, partial [Burkholderiales bacterium]
SGTPAVQGLTTNQLHPSYSHLDISSTDDIGNGNKVIFNYQFDISGTSSANPASARGAIGNRNSYLGVAGTWGTFKMGVNENVYERHMYQADPLDGAAGPGGNLLILANASSPVASSTIFEVGQDGCDSGVVGSGCVSFYRRTAQTVWYESPNWNGFTFEVDYTLSKYKTATTDPKILSAGAKWQPEGMPFYVDIAIEQHDDMFGVRRLAGTPTAGTGSSDDALQIGGGWTLGDLSLHARFEQLSYELDGAVAGDINKWERDATWFGAKYTLPSGYIGGEFGIAGEADCSAVGGACPATFNSDTGATLIAVGYFHNLSKQSQLQFIYNQIDNDPNARYLGIGGDVSTPGNDYRGIFVGMKHTF